jgi:hypothetical protein
MIWSFPRSIETINQRKLLIKTTKHVIFIEDIDYSLYLSNHAKMHERVGC